MSPMFSRLYLTGDYRQYWSPLGGSYSSFTWVLFPQVTPQPCLQPITPP
jgi:hypothetical protein